MSRYEEYIQRLCQNGKYTPEQAKELALSREVEKHYQSEGDRTTADKSTKSTYTPVGECI